MITMSLYNKIKYSWLLTMMAIITGSGYIGDALTHGSDLKTCLLVILVAIFIMIPNVLIADKLKATKVAKRKFENKISKKYHAEFANVDDNLDTVTITRPDGKIITKKLR